MNITQRTVSITLLLLVASGVMAGGFGDLQVESANQSRSKSDRQKCLDMMLPQDGVACLEKLKKKGK